MTDRKPWIDLAKVLGIWLVVLGHMPHSSPALKTFIFSFHMPLFFFISGYLLKPKSVVEAVRAGWWRLLGLERGPLQDAAAALLLVLAFVPAIRWVERRAPLLMGR